MQDRLIFCEPTHHLHVQTSPHLHKTDSLLSIGQKIRASNVIWVLRRCDQLNRHTSLHRSAYVADEALNSLQADLTVMAIDYSCRVATFLLLALPTHCHQPLEPHLQLRTRPQARQSALHASHQWKNTVCLCVSQEERRHRTRSARRRHR